MAGNSLDSLLEWMKNPQNNIMWGWDAIAAMARSKTNTLLIQEYIARFTTGSYLPSFGGEVPITAGQREERLQDFLLDAPRLSFQRLDPNDPKSKSTAFLTCAILGGVQVTMEHTVDVWHAVKIVETDPLQGPRLILELDLAQVPGNVAADGRVLFDLQYSDNFKLTFGQTDIEQTLGGDFFKALFKKLPADQRIWTLGRIAGGGDESLRPESFKLAVQANRLASRNARDASYGDGALLICLCMVGSQQGGGLPPEYKYLIPDDVGEDYSATVLFEQERIIDSIVPSDVVLDLIADLIGCKDFDVAKDAHGQFLRAEAKSGGVTIPKSKTHLLPYVKDNYVIYITVERPETHVSACGSEPLTVYVEGESVCVKWHQVFEEVLLYTHTGGPEGSVETTRTTTYTLKVDAKYSVVQEDDDIVMKPIGNLDIRLESIDVEMTSPQSDLDWFIWFFIVTQMLLITRQDVVPHIEAALQKTFKVSTSAISFVRDSIQLNFGNAIQGDTFRAPRDVGFFGRINPTQTTFTIRPLEPLVAAGGSQLFSTEPMVDGVNWEVHALEDDDAPGQGSINSSGLYTAPPASAITGRFHRERVVARNLSGYYSSALVTVLVNQVTINPLIQVCDFSGTVELAAGALSGEGLQWSVVNANPAEAGSVAPSIKPDGDHTYTPGAQVADKTYVLDEVVVSNGQGSRSAWVLVIQNPPALIVKPLSTAGLPAGQVQLQAIFNGRDVTSLCTWSLPMNGPGSIDQTTGRYTADAGSVERFVLIFGLLANPLYGDLEGHIILPLPLGKFDAELAMMKT